MLKRFFAYQRLLLDSCDSPFKSVKGSVLGFFFLFLIMFSFIMLRFKDQNTFILPLLSVLLSYNIINSEKKLYELVPVSSKFTVSNLYLFNILAMVLGYLALMLSGFIFLGFILFMFWIFGGTVGNGMPEGVENMPMDLNSILLLVMLYILIIFIGTTVSLIKDKRIRFMSIIGAIALFFGFLYSVKVTLPMAPGLEGFDFLANFGAAPHAPLILLGLGLFTILTIPLSLWAGHKLYTS